MKNYTDVSRKITENDNFIVSINHPMKKNQTAAMFFDNYANYRLGGLPNATAMDIIGLDWLVICVYTATASRGCTSTYRPTARAAAWAFTWTTSR